jgi:hypothetical protein
MRRFFRESGGDASFLFDLSSAMETTVSLNLLDVKEAAERCSYSPRTLRWYANQGKVQAQKVGNQWVFPEQEINRLNDKAAA